MRHPICLILCSKTPLLHVFAPKPNSVWSKRAKLESVSSSFGKKSRGSLWGMTTDNKEEGLGRGQQLCDVFILTGTELFRERHQGWASLRFLSVWYHSQHLPHVQRNVLVSSSQPPAMAPPTARTPSYSRTLFIPHTASRLSIQSLPRLGVLLREEYVTKLTLLCIWVKVLVLTIIKVSTPINACILTKAVNVLNQRNIYYICCAILVLYSSTHMQTNFLDHYHPCEAEETDLYVDTPLKKNWLVCLFFISVQMSRPVNLP